MQAHIFTAEQMRDLDNAKCALYGIVQHLENVIHPSLTARLNDAISKIERTMDDYYTIENETAEQEHAVTSAVAEKNDFCTIWSSDVPASFDDTCLWPFATVLHYQGVKVNIPGCTVLDLWRAADSAVRLSGDYHHIFIEDFTPNADHTELHLVTGS